MNQNLCPFCFEPLIGNGPCLSCGHRIGEPMQGLQQLPAGWILDGKYRIGITLGQGGFGITYLAYDMNLQQKVAIKEYFPGGLVTRSSQFVTPYTQSGQGLFTKGVDAFYREGQLLARFQTHPNIVHIFNFFRENNSAYFVMEYVEGKSLATYLDEKGGRLSQEETISLLTPVMDALDTLHQAGILHRDIAPDNIYLTKSSQVKLLDFGAAKNELSQHTHSSAAILKPGYAPLEQYSVTGNQGPWTDVYAMGAVIYRCLTGTMPPDAPDRITGREIIPINASGAKVSKNVEAAVMKALSLNIPDRWQRMSDFKNALSDPNVKVTNFKHDTKPVTISNHRQKNNNKKKTMLPLLILLFILLGVAIGWLIITFGIPNYKYSRAVNLMNSGNYDEAITSFADLGFYKDSQQKISECEALKREERFEYMLNLLSTGTSDQTIEAFNILDEYSDLDHYEKAISYEVQVLMGMAPENAAGILNSITYDDALQLMTRINDLDSQFSTAILTNCGLRLQAAFLGTGDILKFGKYEQDNNSSNGAEDIEWIILEKQDDSFLLISQYALDCIPFHSTSFSITWEKSTIRKWLNNDFINQAFSSEEQIIIQDTIVRAEKSSTYNTNPGNNTTDKVFLLSINEAKQYFPSDENRKAKATDYAKQNNAYTSNSGSCFWWLRTPGFQSNKVTYITNTGSVGVLGYDVNFSRNSVRPALWINFNQ